MSQEAMMSMSFDKWLAGAMAKKGMSRGELARQVGLSEATIYKLETGRIKNPRPDTRAQLQKVLGEAPPSTVKATQEAAIPLSFDRWLASALAKKGMSRGELARQVGLSEATIYKLETGRVKNPRADTRAQLQKVLGEAPPSMERAIEEATQLTQIDGVLVDFDPEDFKSLPTGAGVYVLYDISERPIYIGQSENLRRRMGQHFTEFWYKSPIVETGSYVLVGDAKLRKQLEEILISFLKSNAVVNTQHVDR